MISEYDQEEKLRNNKKVIWVMGEKEKLFTYDGEYLERIIRNEERIGNLARILESHLEKHKHKDEIRTNLVFMLISAIIGSIIGGTVTALIISP